MRSLCTLLGVLSLLLGSLPATTAHAQTRASLDAAISALQDQFAAKSGVIFSQRTRRGDFVLTVARGKRRFAHDSRLYAADVTESSTFGQDVDPVHARRIHIGSDIYFQGDFADVPEGKEWVHRKDRNLLRRNQSLIEALNPEFLRLAAPGARRVPTKDRYDGVRTTRYDGLTEVDHLSSYWAGYLYGQGAWTGGRIKWKLWLGPDNLPRRFHAELVYKPYGPQEKADSVRMNVLYKGWGTPVRVQSPRKSLVAEAE